MLINTPDVILCQLYQLIYYGANDPVYYMVNQTFLYLNFYCPVSHHFIHFFQECADLILIHVGYLEYPSYIITVNFYGLEDQKYHIDDINLMVSKSKS